MRNPAARSTAKEQSTCCERKLSLSRFTAEYALLFMSQTLCKVTVPAVGKCRAANLISQNGCPSFEGVGIEPTDSRLTRSQRRRRFFDQTAPLRVAVKRRKQRYDERIPFPFPQHAQSPEDCGTAIVSTSRIFPDCMLAPPTITTCVSFSGSMRWKKRG